MSYVWKFLKFELHANKLNKFKKKYFDLYFSV